MVIAGCHTNGHWEFKLVKQIQCPYLGSFPYTAKPFQMHFALCSNCTNQFQLQLWACHATHFFNGWRAADATMISYLFGLPFHVLLCWIEIEITTCSYLLTYIFIGFFANMTTVMSRQCCES